MGYPRLKGGIQTSATSFQKLVKFLKKCEKKSRLVFILSLLGSSKSDL